MKSANIKIILILIMCLSSNFSVNAAEDIEVEIKSINKLEKIYAVPQKIQLHLDFAKLYAEKSKWWKYYKHIKGIFDACPEIKGAKIILVNQDYQNTSEKKPVPIDPYIVKRLKNIGVLGVENQDQALEYLMFLKPICDVKCVKPDEKNFLKE